MKETAANDLAAEVQRLRAQVVDLGEALATLTTGYGEQGQQIRALLVITPSGRTA